MDITDFALDLFSLEGRNAIVTGGNTGLGRAFALALAKGGADVLVPSLVDDDGTTRELVEAEGVRYEFMRPTSRRPARPAASSTPASSASARSTSWSTAPASARSPTCSTSVGPSGTRRSPSTSPPRSR